MRRRLFRKYALVPFVGLLFSACGQRSVAVIAHRGVSAEAPENTLPAIQRAIDIGCDYAEVDVRQTQDGRVVLIHDETVERTTTGHGKVADLTYAQLQELDAGVKFSERFTRTRVPSLEQAIELARGKIKLYLDLKTSDPDAVVQLVRKHGFSRSACYRAYTPHVLERIRFLDRDAEILFDPDEAINLPGVAEMLTQKVPGVILGGRLSNWQAKTVAVARQLGARFFVNVLAEESTPENLRRAVSLNPSAIQTDDPSGLLKILGGSPRK